MRKSSKGASAPVSKSTATVLQLAPVIQMRRLASPLDGAALACIEKLQELLWMARNGELNGFAIVAVGSADDGTTQYTTEVAGSAWARALNVIGAMEILRHDLLQEATK